MSASLSDTAVSIVHSVQLPSALVTSLSGQSAAAGDAMMTSLVELACKLTCNVVTTCAHIVYGKVYENLMIDLAVRCVLRSLLSLSLSLSLTRVSCMMAVTKKNNNKNYN